MDNVVNHPSSNLQQIIVVALEQEINKMLEDTNYPYRKEKNVDNVPVFNKEGNKKCVKKL